MDNIYYNYDKLLSYNCLLNIVIGERGVGKSYGAKKYVLKHYKKTKRKFVWLRRFGADLDSAIGNAKICHWFKDISKEFPGKNMEISEDNKIKYMYLNDNLCGYGMSLKGAESLKGTDFNDVDTIIFDEFLVGDGGSHYIKDECMYLLSIIETISRLRKIRVIMLGNATSVVNPYFEFLNIHIPYGKSFKTFKDNTIVVNYIKNEEYRKVKRESEFGKLIKGTKYEEYAIENKFINDNIDFIKKRPKNSKIFFNISLDNKILGVWYDKNKYLYVSNKNQIENSVNISFNYKSHNKNSILLKGKNVFMNNLANHYKAGLLYFENLSIKHDTIELMHTCNII